MVIKVRLTLACTTAALVAAACVYFATRTPKAEAPRGAAVEQLAAEVELQGSTLVSEAGDSTAEALRRSPVRTEPSGGGSPASGTRTLRVVLEGLAEESALKTRVSLAGVDSRREYWPSHLGDSWKCQGLESEFDLDPFFTSVAGATNWDLQVDGLEVKIIHPLNRIERVSVPLSRGVELESGQILYEVRVRLIPGVPHVYWPELTLAVRDAHTREHLEGVELRCVPTAFMASGWMLPGTGGSYTSLGAGLNSPIALLGGREADAPKGLVAGLALQPTEGGTLDLLELVQPEAIDRGVVVYARAPGYSWGRITLDVSTGAERELLLPPAATLGVRLTNVQLERYAALESQATLCVVQPDPRGGEDLVWFQSLDETAENEQLLLEGLAPGEYHVSVELGGAFSWNKRPVLAREELSLAPGEARDLVLALVDPPTPPVLASLGGVVSFPEFGGEEEVRLQLYETATYRYGGADVELTLADMERVGGAMPTWSFRVEDLPVGLYQVRLRPFMVNRMIEVQAGGREDVELVVPELAEVLVETVDAQTGERTPLEKIRFGNLEQLPGKVNRQWVQSDFEGEPGRFRFFTAPGPAFIKTLGIPDGLDYGVLQQKDLELIPGPQSVRFELSPAYAIRFEFRDGGAALPRGDEIWVGVTQGIRAVDHEGRVTGNKLFSDRLVEVNAPGVYEITFEGIGADRFLPIPPRHVDVIPGERAAVIVELRRK